MQKTYLLVTEGIASFMSKSEEISDKIPHRSRSPISPILISEKNSGSVLSAKVL